MLGTLLTLVGSPTDAHSKQYYPTHNTYKHSPGRPCLIWLELTLAGSVMEA